MRIALTEHAIERYVERVKPHLELAEARAELERLADMCPGPSEPPAHLRERRDDADAFAEIAPGIWLVLLNGRALTCLTNAGLSEAARRNRNRRKAEHRRAKRQKQRPGRPPRPAPEATTW